MSEQSAAPASTDTAAAADAAAAASATPPASTDTTGSPPPDVTDAGTTAPAPDAGQQSPDTSKPQGTSLDGSNDAPPPQDWTASLDDDTRQLVETKGYKSPADLAKAYKELSSKLGERTIAPKDDAPAEEWDQFYKRLGRPDTPEDYQFGVPEGVPENVPYDQDFALEFKAMAHEAGLTPKQASDLHNKYVARMANQLGQIDAEVNERVAQAHTEITKEWGDPDTDTYRFNVEMASRTLRQNPDVKDALANSGLLDAGGNVTNAAVAKFLSNVGQTKYREDSLYSGPAGNVNNPFSDKSHNMTQQMAMIKNDPQKAATMIRAAGKKPADFGLNDA